MSKTCSSSLKHFLFLPPSLLPSFFIVILLVIGSLKTRSTLLVKFFFKFNFIFKLYNIVLVLPNIKMNLPQVYPCSPSRTLLPPPSPYPPSGSSQCTSPKHPVSCIEPGLATRFIHDSIHVSVPFSQISPPSPSPTESIRLIYVYDTALSSVSCSVISDSLRPQGFSVYGISKARILEWVAIPSSRGSSQPKDQTEVSSIAVFFPEPPGKPYNIVNYRQKKKKKNAL